jgi:hypothetical protein
MEFGFGKGYSWTGLWNVGYWIYAIKSLIIGRIGFYRRGFKRHMSGTYSPRSNKINLKFYFSTC